MIDITYRRLAFEFYPPQGTMDDYADWMTYRSAAFGVMSARYFRAQAERAKGKR